MSKRFFLSFLVILLFVYAYKNDLDKDFTNFFKSDFQKAETALLKKDYALALHHYKIEALNKNVEAMNKIGNINLNINKNYKNAIYWYKQALLNKDSKAGLVLSLLYLDKNTEFYNEELGLKYLRKSSSLGNEKAKILLEKYTKIDNKLKVIASKITSIKDALRYDSVKLLKLVLKREDLDINEKKLYDYTPLLSAAADNKLEIVKVLVKNGADVKAKTNFGFTVLHRAAMKRGDSSNLEYLYTLVPEYVNAKDDNGSTPLRASVSSNALQEGGSVSSLNFLLNNGAREVINNNYNGYTLLMISSDVKVNKILLANGANPNIKNMNGLTAIGVYKKGLATIKHVNGSKEHKVKLKKDYDDAILHLSYYVDEDKYKNYLNDLKQLSLNDIGLMWERKTFKNRLDTEKVSYCDTLTWLGYEDWRLPTSEDYDSIMLNEPIKNQVINGIDSYYMDPKKFPNMFPTSYLIKFSENSYALFDTARKNISFGIDLDKKYNIRCVRKSN